MYFPDEKMKVNAFKAVAIPRPCDYMKRFGASSAPANMYSGDERVPLPQSKVDMLADAEAYDAMMQKVEDERQEQQ